MLKSHLDALAGFVGFPVDQLTAALCLILSIPFAFVLHNVVLSRRLRFLTPFCSAAPTYYLLYLSFWVGREGQKDRATQFALDLLSINLPIIATFALLRYRPRMNPIWIFVGLLALVSYHHISRQITYYNQYVVNVTGPLMVMVIKLSAFAFDVFDGKIQMKKVKFVQFYAWSMFFAGFFTGPVVHYRQFTAFTEDPLAFLGLTRKQRHAIRGRKRRVIFLLSSAAVLICTALVFKARFPHSRLLEVSQSSEPLWYRLSFMHLSLLEWRFKYYVAWMLAEAGIVIVGLGYKVGDHIQWNRYQNINPLLIESTCDFKTIIAEWNVSTNQWLNTYIYQRMGKTFFANLTTYLVSALWHGFYPGYYFTFVGGALYTALCRQIYRKFMWPFSPRLRHLLLYVPNYLVVDYLAAPFSLQTAVDSWEFAKTWRFYGHLALVLGFLLATLMKSKRS